MGKYFDKWGLGLRTYWWEQEHYLRLLWIGTDSIFSYVNAYQRASTAEEDLNEVDKIPHCGCQSAALPSHCSAISMRPWTEAVVARMEAMYGFNSMEFPLLKLAWLELLVSTDQHWVPNTTPFPGGMSQPPSCRLTTLDLFYHGGAEIPSHENRYISWVHICLPCPYMLLDSTTIFAFRECLIHCLGILHSIASDQETSFHSKEVQAHPMELTVLTT